MYVKLILKKIALYFVVNHIKYMLTIRNHISLKVSKGMKFPESILTIREQINVLSKLNFTHKPEK
jgi:hypothetical protein